MAAFSSIQYPIDTALFLVHTREGIWSSTTYPHLLLFFIISSTSGGLFWNVFLPWIYLLAYAPSFAFLCSMNTVLVFYLAEHGESPILGKQRAISSRSRSSESINLVLG